jgi:hypothetical protein
MQTLGEPERVLSGIQSDDTNLPHRLFAHVACRPSGLAVAAVGRCPPHHRYPPDAEPRDMPDAVFKPAFPG